MAPEVAANALALGSERGCPPQRGVPMLLLILVVALVILDILAYYVGIDSRDGFNRTPTVR
jgi:hypothetical protein